MGKIRFYFTVFVTKLIIKFMHLVGRNATDFPGRIALKLCPDIIGRITPPKHVIAVTGTNGKTSTNNIVSSVLKYNGYSVIDNSFGGNINSGIASILLTYCNFKGVCTQQYACLEIDERSSLRIYPYLKPEYILVTNLQRDSMMRNANVEFIFNVLNKYIPESSKLILNGDDLTSSQLGKNNQKTYFRIDLQDGEICRDNIIKDITICPNCGSDIQWDFVRNHSIGQGHCPNCEFGSPKASYIVKKVHDSQLDIESKDGLVSFPLVGYRTSDWYNSAACVTLLKEVGLTDEEIQNGLAHTIIPKSRFTDYNVNGRRIISILSKGMNAVACSNSFDVVSRDKTRKGVIMYLDDGHDSANSSEMISWIYDTDFEFLKEENIKQIVVGGKRSADYNVRMQLAGINPEIISHCFNPVDTAKYLDVKDLDTIYILFDMYDIPSYEKILSQVKENCEKEGK